VPFGPFVVKNGSKIFCRMCSGMPVPVSLTSTRTSPPGPSPVPVRRVSVPPCGIASSALSTRLVNASRSSAGSPAIRGSRSASTVTTSTAAPRRALS